VLAAKNLAEPGPPPGIRRRTELSPLEKRDAVGVDGEGVIEVFQSMGLSRFVERD
jgi:hypothetical protein